MDPFSAHLRGSKPKQKLLPPKREVATTLDQGDLGLVESPYGSELEPGLDQAPGDSRGLAICDGLTVRTTQREESGADTDGVGQLCSIIPRRS